MNPNDQSPAADITKCWPSSTTAAMNPRSRGTLPNRAPAVGHRVNDPLAVGIEEFANNPYHPLPFEKNKDQNLPTMKPAPLKDNILKDIPTQFALPAPAARQVFLAGDFNDWDSKSMPMRKGHDGVWRRNVPLKPGRHEYRFVADGVWRDDPTARQRIANAMGGENCVRNVAG